MIFLPTVEEAHAIVHPPLHSRIPRDAFFGGWVIWYVEK